jgi:hypothetical protein
VAAGRSGDLPFRLAAVFEAVFAPGLGADFASGLADDFAGDEAVDLGAVFLAAVFF